MIYKYYIDIDTGGLWRSHKDEGASVYTSTIYEHFISTTRWMKKHGFINIQYYFLTK